LQSIGPLSGSDDLPNYAARELRPLYRTPQLVFAGIGLFVLYGSFVIIRTVRHRDYFRPRQTEDEEAHAPLPARTIFSSGPPLCALESMHEFEITDAEPNILLRKTPPEFSHTQDPKPNYYTLHCYRLPGTPAVRLASETAVGVRGVGLYQFPEPIRAP
jgi:Ca2+/H+ antiporter